MNKKLLGATFVAVLLVLGTIIFVGVESSPPAKQTSASIPRDSRKSVWKFFGHTEDKALLLSPRGQQNTDDNVANTINDLASREDAPAVIAKLIVRVAERTSNSNGLMSPEEELKYATEQIERPMILAKHELFKKWAEKDSRMAMDVAVEIGEKSGDFSSVMTVASVLTPEEKDSEYYRLRNEGRLKAASALAAQSAGENQIKISDVPVNHPDYRALVAPAIVSRMVTNPESALQVALSERDPEARTAQLEIISGSSWGDDSPMFKKVADKALLELEKMRNKN